MEQQEQYLEFLYFNKEDIRPFPINIQQFDHFQLFRNFSGWTPSTTPLRLQYIHHCDYTGLPAIIECSHSSVPGEQRCPISGFNLKSITLSPVFNFPRDNLPLTPGCHAAEWSFNRKF